MYRNGKKNGMFTAYFPNGEIEEYGYFKYGLKNGNYYKYYKNGLLKSEAKYQLGELVRRVLYNPDGSKRNNIPNN